MQGIPPATITWVKDDVPLEIDSHRMTVLPSGSLEIDDVQLGDQGTYHCNASNMDRYRTSQGGYLTVNLDTGLSYVYDCQWIAGVLVPVDIHLRFAVQMHECFITFFFIFSPKQ